MKVCELIEILKKHPQDIPVLVNGYEGGYEDIVENSVCQIKVLKNYNNASYYGPHEEVGKSHKDYDKADTCLLISR